jgi:hypothetical protein
MLKGFVVGKGMEYAAIPYASKGYIIVHNGKQLDKICRTESSARKYISDHKKGRPLGKLPLS